jgi:potassium/hydrogen antiporter
MTNYIILALCVIVLLAYIFDITSKYSRIPGVILLIVLGLLIQLLAKAINLEIPNLKPVFPVIGTLGLILIIMEASLDLKLEKNKKVLIFKSISSALGLFIAFTGFFTVIMTAIFDFSVRASILNGIPLGIISSSVAITSSRLLPARDREFIVYESSFSDIFGIIVFDFFLLNNGSIGLGILHFGLTTLLTLLIAIVTSSVLAFLLHKITYHVNYVIIMTSVVLVYILGELSHLPALLLILVFGIILSNNQLLEYTPVNRIFNFGKFRDDLESFKKILVELTFVVRSFFFIMFGYYTKVDSLLDWHNIVAGVVITAGILAMRIIYLKLLLKMPAVPLLFFSPRGLITILLFLSIPEVYRIPIINEEVITIVILLTILIMMIGNIFYKKGHPSDQAGMRQNQPVFPVNV